MSQIVGSANQIPTNSAVLFDVQRHKQRFNSGPVHATLPLSVLLQLHVSPPFSSKLQSRPHWPQFPLLTRSTHLLLQQPGCVPVQALLHAPQCLMSVLVSTQLPLQQV